MRVCGFAGPRIHRALLHLHRGRLPGRCFSHGGGRGHPPAEVRLRQLRDHAQQVHGAPLEASERAGRSALGCCCIVCCGSYRGVLFCGSLFSNPWLSLLRLAVGILENSPSPVRRLSYGSTHRGFDSTKSRCHHRVTSVHFCSCFAEMAVLRTHHGDVLAISAGLRSAFPRQDPHDRLPVHVHLDGFRLLRHRGLLGGKSATMSFIANTAPATICWDGPLRQEIKS